MLACAVSLLTGCGAKVTQLNLALPESVNVGESVQASLTAEYDNADAGDEEKEKALAGLEIVWAGSDETGTVTGIAGGNEDHRNGAAGENRSSGSFRACAE